MKMVVDSPWFKYRNLKNSYTSGYIRSKWNAMESAQTFGNPHLIRQEVWRTLP